MTSQQSIVGHFPVLLFAKVQLVFYSTEKQKDSKCFSSFERSFSLSYLFGTLGIVTTHNYQVHMSIKSSSEATFEPFSPNLRFHTPTQLLSPAVRIDFSPLRFDSSFLLLPFLYTLTELLASVCSAAWLIYLSYQGKSPQTRRKKK